MERDGEMRNQCYNCKKQFFPDRACMSDGDCSWFEPVDRDVMNRVMMDTEQNNITWVPEILTIEVRKSPKTGQYYMRFIDFTDTTIGNGGYWTNRIITERCANNLLKMCYPKWDGEHPLTCCTDDDIYENEWKMKDSRCNEFDCLLDCPHKGNGNTAKIIDTFMQSPTVVNNMDRLMKKLNKLNKNS